MGRRLIKKEIITLLSTKELPAIFNALASYSQQSLLNPLFIALCSPLEHVRWNAVHCFGRVVPTIAEEDVEAARVVMRRFLWTLNDESGGIGWGAPESMAVIMCRSALLREEYLHMLISYMREDGEEEFQDGNYLELPMLQRGLLWGVGRLCKEYPEEMMDRGVVADLIPYTKSPDEQVQGMALWAIGNLNVRIPTDSLSSIRRDASLRLCDNGGILELPFTKILDQVEGSPVS